MRASIATCLVLLVGGVGGLGCESAEEKCGAAKDEMRTGLRTAADTVRGEVTAAETARGEAMDTLSAAVMDLGNIRSDAVVTAIGADEDGAIGVEVSIGAMMAALLAVERLADSDPESADRIATAAQAEIEGRYRELMTLDVAGDGAASRLAEVGDGCSTDLQNLVRELPADVRGSVLARFTALEADEEAPEAGTDYEQVESAFSAYGEAREAATAAKARSALVIAALDALDGSPASAREAFDALPADVDVGAAREAAARAWEVCE
jgi:hypothetical protein